MQNDSVALKVWDALADTPGKLFAGGGGGDPLSSVEGLKAMFRKIKRTVGQLLRMAPGPVVMIALLLPVATGAAFAARGVDPSERDWAFLGMYSACAVVWSGIAALVFYVLTDALPAAALAGLLVSILGVLVSVSVDRTIRLADADAVRESEEDDAATTRRIIWLHTASGAILASLVAFCIPMQMHGVNG